MDSSIKLKPPIPKSVKIMTGLGVLILLFCSGLRHILLQSTAFDLVWFDQATYLISQGQEPIISLSGFHILGDHAALIFYPLALLYKLYPTVYWLFLVQAIALSSGTILSWALANQAGIGRSLAIAVACTYGFYPLVFNVNLADFHPEVIAIPGILGAVFAARANAILYFIALILLVLSCKAVLSLTVIGLGIWLMIFEKKQAYGFAALTLGLAWFLISTQVIFPFFTGDEHAAVDRYHYLGESVLEILLNLIKQPNILLSRIFDLESLEYLILLFLPIIWGISLSNLPLLIAILPQLGLNLLSDVAAQRNLVHQYSVPILPFLILAVIASLAGEKAWFKTPRIIVIWSIIGFIALAKPGYFWTRYLDQLDTWQASRAAIAQVTTQGGVLTTSNLAPQLSHRTTINQTEEGIDTTNFNAFDYVILNLRHPGWASSAQLSQDLLQQLETSSPFIQQYQQDDVYLFVRSSNQV
jgi:uncharacterized membrane protein